MQRGRRRARPPRHLRQHLARRSVALKVIYEWMGRATIEMTMRYAHLSLEERGTAVQELDRPIPSRTPP